MKAFGPNTISLIKQNQKGKVMFQGRLPFEKFGKFAELTDSSESRGSFEKASTCQATSEPENLNDDVIDVSDHEDEATAAPNAIVAEEHDLHNMNVQSDFVEGSNKELTEIEGGEEVDYEDLDLSGYD